jgi:hypothetical protein
MRWGQAPSSAWPGDVAWVRRLHAVEEGTPDLGYRQILLLPTPLCIRDPVVSLLELALPSKMIQRGSESNADKVLAQEGNCSVNLASQGHCAGVFIGA